jgi:hypothetical protein
MPDRDADHARYRQIRCRRAAPTITGQAAAPYRPLSRSRPDRIAKIRCK